MSAPSSSLPIVDMAAAIAAETPSKTPSEAAPTRRRGEPWRRRSWAEVCEQERFYREKFFEERTLTRLARARASCLFDEVREQKQTIDRLKEEVNRGKELRKYLRK